MFGVYIIYIYIILDTDLELPATCMIQDLYYVCIYMPDIIILRNPATLKRIPVDLWPLKPVADGEPEAEDD